MYFPKSQITPNQYTNGGEFVYASTKLPYIGYYFSVSTGKYYTGKNTADRPNEELLFITTKDYPDNPQISLVVVDPLYDYLTNSNTDNPPILIPYYNPVTPTQQDYQNGEFQRYFCKKTNEIQYIEINLDQFTKLKAQDPQILYQLYQPFTIAWILTGDKEQVAKINRNIVELASFRQKLPRFGDYLKFDYLKYYK